MKLNNLVYYHLLNKFYLMEKLIFVSESDIFIDIFQYISNSILWIEFLCNESALFQD